MTPLVHVHRSHSSETSSSDQALRRYALVAYSWVGEDRSLAEDICDDLDRRCEQELPEMGVLRCTHYENEPDDPLRIARRSSSAAFVIIFVSNNFQESYTCRLIAETAKSARVPIMFVELEEPDDLGTGWLRDAMQERAEHIPLDDKGKLSDKVMQFLSGARGPEVLAKVASAAFERTHTGVHLRED